MQKHMIYSLLIWLIEIKAMFSINSIFVFVGALIIVVAIFNTHNIYALFWKAENTTVFLSKCKENCILKGTLRVKPFDGMLYLTYEGTVTHLRDGTYKEIRYPTM